VGRKMEEKKREIKAAMTATKLVSTHMVHSCILCISYMLQSYIHANNLLYKKTTVSICICLFVSVCVYVQEKKQREQLQQVELERIKDIVEWKERDNFQKDMVIQVSHVYTCVVCVCVLLGYADCWG